MKTDKSKDIRNQSIEALTLIIVNDSFLYENRERLAGYELEEMGYSFTDKQWTHFQNHLNQETED